MPSNMGLFPLKPYFLRNFSYWKAAQLTSEIVVTLSEQNTSQALYFEKSLFWIEQLMMLFAAQEVILILSSSLLHYNVKSSEQLQLSCSLQWFRKYSTTCLIRLTCHFFISPARISIFCVHFYSSSSSICLICHLFLSLRSILFI